jgi:hypothetical protein
MVTIVKKGLKPAGAPAATSAPAASPAAASTPAAAPASAPASVGGLKFLKRGAAAIQGMQQEEKKIEIRQAKNAVRRYWVPKDGKGDITFLDGNLKDGILDIPFYNEHNVNMNGAWGNHFICTQDEEPCPICEGGSSPQYVGVLTVIDHSKYISKSDNKEKKDNVRLFVAKRDTIKLLQTYAIKRGGLRGCRFDVVRAGEKSPNVGSAFDFTVKLSDADLLKNFGKDKVSPINYDQFFAAMYQPAMELRKLGFGSMMSPVGGEAEPAEQGGYDV